MKYVRIYQFKQIIKFLLFLFILSLLLIFSKQNFASVTTSTKIFLSNVFPSLFPFILFTNVLLNSNIVNYLSKILGKPIALLFKIPKDSVIAIIIGFLCGFPMGAKAVDNLYQTHKINHKQAKKLLTFVNNCNPSFILSTIGIAVFYQIQIGVLLLISHYLSAILIGIITNRVHFPSIIHEKDTVLNTFQQKVSKSKVKITSNNSFFYILKQAIFNTFITMGTIFGFIILFNLAFSILSTLLTQLQVPEKYIAILSSLFEITKGCQDIYLLNISIIEKITLCSFALGLSGFCIIAQIYATVIEDGFSLIDILVPKIFQGIISAIITYILLRFTNMTSLTSSAFSSIETIDTLNYLNHIKNAYLTSTIMIVIAIMLYLILDYTLQKKK